MLNAAFIDRYFSEMRQILDMISREDIDRVIDALFAAWREGRRVFLMGNGGPASTATHFACDLAKVTVCEGKPRLRAVSLCDNPALISALTNDEGFAQILSEQIRGLMRPRDVLIGISVHGGGAGKAEAWSQNLLRAMQVAKGEFQATVMGFSGFDGGAFRQTAGICLTVPFPSTPQVMSFHLALEHLITFCLKEKIVHCP
jgi:D-sedoheptulose 7-phosphate isomerase